ncbi:MAG: hypothetical protein IT538_01260 [Variibacter sp.]|nr:hypothetical protein [Variibacter sp.]
MADPELAAALKRPFAEQVAFFRGKLARLVPTARWDDIRREAHDSAFMVAGAAKADLLADLAAAVDRAVTEGRGLESFRKDFRSIVARNGWHGWTGEGSLKGEAWRTRVIYQTNAATSYAAGRQAQLVQGGFDLWVYRHGESRVPRPQHLAWDGICLPPDDKFWSTHYPPNGWGCSCYVVGARSPAGARRLGGDPGKALPEDWDAVDRRTGAPAGIDRGWDYAPGASVARTVATMAQKTVQWETTLAKAFMESVPARQRDALALAYRRLPSVAEDARRYAERVMGERNGAAITAVEIEPYRTLGPLTRADAARVADLKGGFDVAGYDYALESQAVRHVAREHGAPAAEAARGQRAVTAADYALVPRILAAPDSIEDAGISAGHRLPQIMITKRIGGELYTAVFEARERRRSMVLVTMWIRAARRTP